MRGFTGYESLDKCPIKVLAELLSSENMTSMSHECESHKKMGYSRGMRYVSTILIVIEKSNKMKGKGLLLSLIHI